MHFFFFFQGPIFVNFTYNFVGKKMFVIFVEESLIFVKGPFCGHRFFVKGRFSDPIFCWMTQLSEITVAECVQDPVLLQIYQLVIIEHIFDCILILLKCLFSNLMQNCLTKFKVVCARETFIWLVQPFVTGLLIFGRIHLSSSIYTPRNVPPCSACRYSRIRRLRSAVSPKSRLRIHGCHFDPERQERSTNDTFDRCYSLSPHFAFLCLCENISFFFCSSAGKASRNRCN